MTEKISPTPRRIAPKCPECGKKRPVNPAHHFTPAERKALREAGQEALAGMFQGNLKALESALENL